MAKGLSPARIVDVDVSFAPLAVPLANFDTLLIMGTSDVIDVGEGVRTYNDIASVAADFGTTAREYLAAALYFGQTPQPDTLYIGRWANTDQAGRLTCGVQSVNSQLMSAWTTITNGCFKITINNIGDNVVTGVDFTGVKNMVQVAARIDQKLTGAKVAWNGFQFLVTSQLLGPTAHVGFMRDCTAEELSGSGLPNPYQLAGKVKGMGGSAQPSYRAVRSSYGWLHETPVAGVTRVDGLGWYAVMFAPTLNAAQYLAISAYCQAGIHLHGLTTHETRDPEIFIDKSTLDLASQMRLAGYTRTVMMYSKNSLSIASFFGRAFTVNFEGFNTTITMMFKQMPGVIPEELTATQASTLTKKRCNVYAMYINGVPILQEGMVSGLAYFDEVHGTDWLANRIQTDVYNVMLQSPKIPQTNPGVHILKTAMASGLSQAVTNGLVAPGVWNAPGFGALQQGDYLVTGFYTYAANVDSQPPSMRETRRAPLMQAAIKMAGAVHFADVIVNVNR